MQHSTSQYDDLAGFPGTRTGEGCRPRTTAPRHRRHPSARRSCGVVAPVRDARLVDLILAVFKCSNSGRRQERVWRAQRPEPKSTLSRVRLAAETARPVFEPRKRPHFAGYSSETRKRRFASKQTVISWRSHPVLAACSIAVLCTRLNAANHGRIGRSMSQPAFSRDTSGTPVELSRRKLLKSLALPRGLEPLFSPRAIWSRRDWILLARPRKIFNS